MSTEVAIQSGNFAAMAQAMGLSQDAPKKKSSSMLPRFRVWNQPVMGEVEVKGKKKRMEIVEAPSFRLEQEDGTFVYASQARVRTFMQRFMLKKYDASAKMYVKTYMGDNLNQDLKDNTGGFNCGKPSGYIKDWNALPKDVQDLIRSVKRVRVVFGIVEMIGAVDANGNDVEIEPTPFIFEVENKDSFRNIGNTIGEFSKLRKLPLQHWMNLSLDAQETAKGDVFGIVESRADMSESLDITDEDQTMFRDFTVWVENYNEYILNQWNEKSRVSMSAEDEDLVGSFVDVDDADLVDEA